jgi:hypothetical protein
MGGSFCMALGQNFPLGFGCWLFQVTSVRTPPKLMRTMTMQLAEELDSVTLVRLIKQGEFLLRI